MPDTPVSKKDRYEVVHLGLHGAEWIVIIWDRREKRVAGSTLSKSLDKAVEASREIIRSLQ
jgi:hypothetical protein